MATSGVYSFSISTSDIIEQAYRDSKVYGRGTTINSYDFNDAKIKLNLMAQALIKQGTHLWTVQNATLFLKTGIPEYSLGSSLADDNCTLSYSKTTLSADATALASSINLDSTEGLNTADYIGIQQSNGDLFWANVTGAPINPVSIDQPLPIDAPAGNIVFFYKSKIQRPLRVIRGTIYRRDINDNDTPVMLIDRSSYANLSNKFSTGKINQVSYDPILNSGVLRTWSAPDLETDVLRFSFDSPFQSFVSLNDNPDFPIEWGEALITGLAFRIGRSRGSPDVDRLERYADRALEVAGYDKEVASIYFEPDLRG